MNKNRRTTIALATVCAAVMLLSGSSMVPALANAVGIQGMPMSSPTVTSTNSGPWSSTSTWQGGMLPQAGDSVEISSGTTVTYDMASSPVLGNITVDGTLVFSLSKSTSIAFVYMNIDPMGYVQVGTASNPVPAGVTTKLYLAATTEGAAGIIVMGQLDMHGSSIGSTWVNLGANANAGAKTMTLAQAVSWNVGDHIVITTTTLSRHQNEENFIKSISGNAITLQTPLTYEHDGSGLSAGQVADLTRNVVVTSLNSKVHGMGVMFMNMAILASVGMGMPGMGAPMGLSGISYAEFSYLGGKGILGNYPVHFHHMWGSAAGTVIEGISVWNSNNRCLTIHNSDGITVDNAVCYNAIGHGFFLEDGTEEYDLFTNNLAIYMQAGSIRPDDKNAAGFWIQNPQNTLNGDVAVAAAGNGFDYATNDPAPNVIPFNAANYAISVAYKGIIQTAGLSILSFQNDQAHGNGGSGFRIYEIISPTSVNVFNGMLMWRNGEFGFWARVSEGTFTSFTLFGNAAGNMQTMGGNFYTFDHGTLMGELQGIKSTKAQVSGQLATIYSPAPNGLEMQTGSAVIKNSLFEGHALQPTTPVVDQQGKTTPAGDIINQPVSTAPYFAIYVSNTILNSATQISFGYPANLHSFMQVLTLNGNPSQNFVLFRSDVTPQQFMSGPQAQIYKGTIGTCAAAPNYGAMECQVLKPAP